MKGRVLNIIIACLLIGGMGAIFYPLGTSYMVEREAKKTVRNFKEITIIREQSQGQSEGADESAVQDRDLNSLYSDMQKYNEELFETGQVGLIDPFSYETAAFDLKNYGFKDEVLGYISIARMNVELPILLGATKENMGKGAVNLGMTSIPIGGVNSNAVLAAHRGYSGAAMFRDIELLQKGDLVCITNFWETMTYEVEEIRVILPTDIQEVQIEEGKDMVTLVTCHPYAQNYQRYAVYCVRTGGIQAQSESRDSGLELKYIFKMYELSLSQQKIFIEHWLPIGIGIYLFLLILIAVIWRRCIKRNKK